MTSRYFRDDVLLESRGMASRLHIALALVAARRAAGLTQLQLAQRAAWHSQFVCRLESLHGRLPNLLTLIRYARACQLDLGLLFSTPDTQPVHVIRAVTLQASHSHKTFEALSGRGIAVPSSAASSLMLRSAARSR